MNESAFERDNRVDFGDLILGYKIEVIDKRQIAKRLWDEWFTDETTLPFRIWLDQQQAEDEPTVHVTFSSPDKRAYDRYVLDCRGEGWEPLSFDDWSEHFDNTAEDEKDLTTEQRNEIMTVFKDALKISGMKAHNRRAWITKMVEILAAEDDLRETMGALAKGLEYISTAEEQQAEPCPENVTNKQKVTNYQQQAEPCSECHDKGYVMKPTGAMTPFPCPNGCNQQQAEEEE